MAELTRRRGLLVADAEADEERGRDRKHEGQRQDETPPGRQAPAVRDRRGAADEGRVEVGEDGIELGCGLGGHQDPFREARSAVSAR